MIQPLLALINAHKQNRTIGMYSVCSAHPEVLRAAMEQAKVDKSMLLIESTSNQVDQYGGYTGMTPTDFVSYLYEIADTCQYPREKVIIGGDHLGPNRWQKEKVKQAMPKAHELIRCCVKAGYRKIHLDTSMRCVDDPGDANTPLNIQAVAERAAELCLTAEKTAAEFSENQLKPVYVIGTDVPKPGGAQHKLTEVHVTPQAEIEQTIEITQQTFLKLGLQEAWERVIAVVIQPGVEFGDTEVFDYQSQKAAGISRFIEDYPHLLYEAHSTDYQRMESLKQMVKDHFAILKVGPWLTFAYREAIFALALIEKEWLTHTKGVTLSGLLEVVEKVMIDNPKYWINHYHGTLTELSFARKYSLSDRIRYYWPDASIQKALKKLLDNLSVKTIPWSLLSQYLPQQFQAVRRSELKNNPLDLILHKIMEITSIYSTATCSNFINSRVSVEEYQTN
jgi:D-tagatose-1,6-bisphosphate aldolase subunit GatZ/KbaZ